MSRVERSVVVALALAAVAPLAACADEGTTTGARTVQSSTDAAGRAHVSTVLSTDRVLLRVEVPRGTCVALEGVTLNGAAHAGRFAIQPSPGGWLLPTTGDGARDTELSVTLSLRDCVMHTHLPREGESIAATFAPAPRATGEGPLAMEVLGVGSAVTVASLALAVEAAGRHLASATALEAEVARVAGVAGPLVIDPAATSLPTELHAALSARPAAAALRVVVADCLLLPDPRGGAATGVEGYAERLPGGLLPDRASGIVWVSASACTSSESGSSDAPDDPERVGRLGLAMAHEIGHALGLFHVEPEVGDDTGHGNLMSARLDDVAPGAPLTEEQLAIVRAHPLLAP